VKGTIMAMTKKDFEEIAGALADAADWVFEGMTPEEMRKALGERLLYVCQAAYSGGYGFDTGRFRRVAKLDD
jgi:hypothetical protein